MGRWITMGLLVLGSLGCSGIFLGDEELVLPDDVAVDEDTGEDDDGAADGDTGLDTAVDTGIPEEKPRKGKKEGRKKKKKPDDGRKGGGKEKKPGRGGGGGGKSTSLCFVSASPKMALRFDVQGSDIVGGSLQLNDGKLKVSVAKITGKKANGRLTGSGKGTVNGKKKTVEVMAGKQADKVTVKVDGHNVKGASKSPCK